MTITCRRRRNQLEGCNQGACKRRTVRSRCKGFGETDKQTGGSIASEPGGRCGDEECYGRATQLTRGRKRMRGRGGRKTYDRNFQLLAH